MCFRVCNCLLYDSLNMADFELLNAAGAVIAIFGRARAYDVASRENSFCACAY